MKNKELKFCEVPANPWDGDDFSQTLSSWKDYTM